MTSISQALHDAINQLSPSHTQARLEAEVLLSHALSKSRSYLFAHPEIVLEEATSSFYTALIKKRVSGMPIAYITGTREFWSLPLYVNAHTLIPRPETERLVELALELIPDNASMRILDLGTGSGAVALALAKERPLWHITACDVCQNALAVAKENASRLKLKNISFYQSDWFQSLPPVRYDAVVSNPPYIAQDDPHLLDGDLRFEPIHALKSGEDGLADLQYIIEHANDFLLPNGLLLLEHGYNQKNNIHAILDKTGYNNIRCWNDIQGHDRISGGWLPNDTI